MLLDQGWRDWGTVMLHFEIHGCMVHVMAIKWWLACR